MPSAERDLIRSEAEHLLEVGRRDLTRQVPQYPGWTMFDLLSHLASVHGRTRIIVTEKPDERPHGPRLPEHGDVERWFADSLDSMLEALEGADPEVAVWGFGSNPTIGGWERRMVIETGLHRWDADQAADETSPLHEVVASFGLDEYADMYLPWLHAVPVIELVASDLGRSWVLGQGAPEARVHGTASDLYLRLMSRPGADLPRQWADAVDALQPPPKL